MGSAECVDSDIQAGGDEKGSPMDVDAFPEQVILKHEPSHPSLLEDIANTG